MGKGTERRKKEKRQLREFKKEKSQMQSSKNSSTTESPKLDTSINKHKFSFVGRAILWIAGGFLAMIGFFPTVAQKILSDLATSWLAYFIIIASCVWLFGILWKLTSLIKWKLFNRKLRIITVSVLVFITGVLVSGHYIDVFLSEQGSIKMDDIGFDSTPITIHYGERIDDFYWTDKTIGELKTKPSVSLRVNDEEVFNIHIYNNQLCVDAKLFSGYINERVPDYKTIGSLDKFSFELSGYFDTSYSGNTKNFVKKTIATEIKNAYLAPPVIIHNNYFTNKPIGWELKKIGTIYEYDNEYGVPVLILKYKNPYELIISGLFVTPMGILKVDNTKDIIFEFADSPYELEPYIVDRVTHPFITDWFQGDRVYILLDKGRR